MTSLDRFIFAARQGLLDELVALFEREPALVPQRDAGGATALHHAAFHGHRAVAEWLIAQGADPNARDYEYSATPAGWAIEYLRERGALLGIELNDFEFALRAGDAIWAERLLTRFPALSSATASDGTPFADLAAQSPHAEIARLFELQSE